MIKKIACIALVLIGMFFLLCTIALLSTIWGAVFCGLIMIGCFYLAYRLYPRKEKKEVVKPTPVKTIEPENTPIIDEEIKITPKPIKAEPYSLNSKEFKEIGETTINYFEKIKHYSLNYNSLTEEDGNNLSDFKYEVEITREKLPDTMERSSIRLLHEIFLAMYDICDDLEYYIEDKDQVWINDISLQVDTINEDFILLTEIIKGEVND